MIAKSVEDLDVLEHPRLKTWMLRKNFVVFGAGGSVLGGQCIRAISGNGGRNVRFVANSDPGTMDELFREIDPNETGFLCISKSGETLETVCQTLLALDFAKKGDGFTVITEDKPSSLKQIAAEFGFLCLDHPKTVGGRFSVFSLTGMLPALLCGVDPRRIRAGGSQVLDHRRDDAEKGASFVTESLQNGITEHVSFIYSDRLIAFGAWLAQLYAESTGKSGVGVTPLTAIGAADQHSQLQLYLEGRRDKCFTFFFEERTSESAVAADAFLPPAFSYLKGRNMANVFEAQFRATAAALVEKNCRVRTMETGEITPEVLGALFMHFMLEVTYICEYLKVNPFDQPAVERGKILTKNLLEKDLCY
ncbi:MAG: hypothetical protein LBO73_03155 [Holosporaceae bacterium]|nr:hypothetical protein [Holosporaceae bacterium]